MESTEGNSSTPSARIFRSVFSHMKWEQLAAGLSGGVVSTLILHPLDLVKVRFQGLSYCGFDDWFELINMYTFVQYIESLCIR